MRLLISGLLRDGTTLVTHVRRNVEGERLAEILERAGLVVIVDQDDDLRVAVFEDGSRMVVCALHAGELGVASRPFGLEDAALTPSCSLCVFPRTPGRTCARDECGTHLHPQWPAVYCSNRCALLDA